MSSTVAGPFDIQSRFYFHVSDPDTNHGEMQRVPRYRKITNFIEDDSVKLVEGLIVDARNGGVGFRNHTIPTRMKYGATSTEDIFFVDSETSCVDLKLTLQYKTPEAIDAGLVSASEDGISMVDNGGFADLKQRPSVPMVNLTDPQANPDLWTRVYKIALMMTAYTAAVWNITNLSTYSGPNYTGEIVRHAFEYVKSDVGQAHNWNRSDLCLHYESLDPKSNLDFLLCWSSPLTTSDKDLARDGGSTKLVCGVEHALSPSIDKLYWFYISAPTFGSKFIRAHELLCDRCRDPP